MRLKEAIKLANELIAEGHEEVYEDKWDMHDTSYQWYRVHAVINGIELYHINANRKYPIIL